jgi:hypothetical protein
MEPDSPSLLHRIRWGNVAWALAALVAIGLVLAWPHLQRRVPGLPNDAASVPTAPAPPPVAPAPPVPSTRPTAPRRHPAPAHHRRARRHTRRIPRTHRRARPPPTPPTIGGGAVSPTPQDTGPTAPAGDQEFLPG